MPRLSLGLGVQAVSKVKGGGAAPSGIPVASTNTIIIVDTAISANFTGTYQKESSTFYRNEADPLISITWDSTQWRLSNDDAVVYVYATPPSNNINYIATTGWPTQTLTAA